MNDKSYVKPGTAHTSTSVRQWLSIGHLFGITLSVQLQQTEHITEYILYVDLTAITFSYNYILTQTSGLL